MWGMNPAGVGIIGKDKFLVLSGSDLEPDFS